MVQREKSYGAEAMKTNAEIMPHEFGIEGIKVRAQHLPKKNCRFCHGRGRIGLIRKKPGGPGEWLPCKCIGMCEEIKASVKTPVPSPLI